MKIIFRSMTITLLTFMLFTFIVTLSYAQDAKRAEQVTENNTEGEGNEQKESPNPNPDESNEELIKKQQLN